jgi:cytochrome oxidase assembly protein ShyY1
MFPKAWLYWLIAGLFIALPLSYHLGKWQGAKEQRTANENAVTLSSAKNDVATVSAISGVKNDYAPFYMEIERDPSPAPLPSCPVPAVIRNAIDRLPAPTRAAH